MFHYSHIISNTDIYRPTFNALRSQEDKEENVNQNATEVTDDARKRKLSSDAKKMANKEVLRRGINDSTNGEPTRNLRRYISENNFAEFSTIFHCDGTISLKLLHHVARRHTSIRPKCTECGVQKTKNKEKRKL